MKIFTFSLIVLYSTTAVAQTISIADNPRLLPLEELRDLEYTWEAEKFDDKKKYTLSLSKASQITHQMIDNAPYIQLLYIDELDSIPDCIKRWKDLQMLTTYNNVKNPYIPEGFGDFFPFMREMSFTISAVDRDILHDDLLDGNYPYLEGLTIYYNADDYHWDDDTESLVTIEGTLVECKIPRKAQNWSNLKRIDFSGASDFGNCAEKWTNLEFIYLADYKGSLDVFSNCTSLEDIILAGEEVNLNGIGALTSLKTLTISGDIGTKVFPAEINKLHNLTDLDVTEGGFEYLPNDMSSMDSLKSIYLSITPLKQLPNSICALSELESISVYDGDLKELPKDIGKLQKLKHLSFENNRIFELPASITKLPALEFIDLTFNRLQRLPEGNYDWGKANYISLEGNQLETLPNGLIEYLGSLHPIETEGRPMTEEGEPIMILMRFNWFKNKTMKKIDRKTNKIIDWYGEQMW